jgi:hypothetical protein
MLSQNLLGVFRIAADDGVEDAAVIVNEIRLHGGEDLEEFASATV